MNTTKHTPAPWKVRCYDPNGYSYDIVSADFDEDNLDGIRIARTSDGYPSKHNAEFIVKACNAYEDLVIACRIALEELKNHGYEGYGQYITIQKALAKAGVKL